MLRIIKQAFSGKTATIAYPAVVAEPPDGFRGKPEIDFERCTACDACAAACPTGAIEVGKVPGRAARRTVAIDYGDCIFCGECEAACPGAIRLTDEFRLAARTRNDLVVAALFQPAKPVIASRASERRGNPADPVIASRASQRRSNPDFVFSKMLTTPSAPASLEETGARLKNKVESLFGRSLHIREVDAGSCNGCEVEITALSNPVYDIERFGIHFVASPRHADMLLVTGPVTRNMEIPLRQTYEATPDPKLVVAVGACAIGGGVFGATNVSCGGADSVIPVDVYIPGCPPRPEALLHGILMAIDRLPR
ncbi:MAG TPA: NADH-quinone oxidoreductase subunit NuoB [Bacteroidota bacterium]|nr:NADH-quinone oxidoreductase subunit NuoB [Bacteroidota bacterium]